MTGMNRWGALVEASRRRHHACSVGLAATCGLDPTTLRRRAVAERWERLHPGVFALPGSPPTPERAISAALLGCRGAIAACRGSAAYLWGLTDDPPEAVDLLIPPGRRAPALSGVRALRSRTVLASDLGVARGLESTTPERTVCDLAAVVEDDYELRALVLTALQRGALALDALERRHHELRAAPGARRLARVLQALDPRQPTSALAYEVAVFLRTRGIRPHPQPLWVTCADGCVRRIDLPFIDQRIGVLVEAGRDPDEVDEAALELTATGWRVARIGWRRFRSDRERWFDGLLRLLTASPQGT